MPAGSCDHRRIVRAHRAAWQERADSSGITGSRDLRTQETVGGDTTAEHDPRCTDLTYSPHRLVDEHINHRLLKRRRHIH